MGLTQASFVAALKRNVRPSKIEGFTDAEYAEFVVEAVKLHNAGYVCSPTVCTIPEQEERAVVLLAWHGMTLARVSFYAAQAATVRAGEFATSAPQGRSLLALAEELARQYQQECVKLSLDVYAGRGPVQVSPIASVPYDYSPSRAPLLAAELPQPFTITAVWSEGALLVTLVAVAVHPRFQRWHLVSKTGDDAIWQAWNTEEPLTGLPCIHDNATVVKVSTNPTTKVFRVTGLNNAEAQRLLVVQEVEGPLYSYSNEVTVAALPGD